MATVVIADKFQVLFSGLETPIANACYNNCNAIFTNGNLDPSLKTPSESDLHAIYSSTSESSMVK